MLVPAQSQLLLPVQPVSVPSDHLGGPAGLPTPAAAALLSPAAPEAGLVVWGEVVAAAAQACIPSAAAAVVADISAAGGGVVTGTAAVEVGRSAAAAGWAVADTAEVGVGRSAAAGAADAAMAVESVWNTR